MQFQLTREQFEKCRGDLAAQGVSLTGDSGVINHSGCTVDFAYTEPTLTITVVHKPFIVSESFVESQVSKWFSAETNS
jgi:hypothetical protein